MTRRGSSFSNGRKATPHRVRPSGDLSSPMPARINRPSSAKHTSMKSRWTEQGAREAIQRWAGPHGEDFALRLYTARLIGEESNLVLHGGGNVSFKGAYRTILGESVETIFVKASGGDLATLEPSG